jgi:quercetin dioxygenase-like cupin family protein
MTIEKEVSRVSLQSQSLPTQAVAPGEGDAYWWFGQLAVIKARAADTGGAYALVEITAAPGYATPLHVHRNEDEGFWMLDGSAAFEVGDETVEAGAGMYLFGPRDIPHRWTAGPDGARMLYVFAPAGMEELIPLSGVPAETLTPPPPDVVPPEHAVEVAARFGGEILAF